MLKYRICAHCGNQIESPSTLFCYHCGELLNGNAVDKDNTRAIVINAPSSSSGRKSRRILAILVTSLITILAVLSVAVATVFLSNSGTSLKSKGSAVLLKNFFYTASERTWTNPLLTEATPDNVGFFFFGADAAAFLERLLTSDQKSRFQNLTGLSLTEAQSYINDRFSFFGDKNSWGFLAQVKSPDFVRTKIMELDKIGQMEASASVISDYLLVSNSSKMVSVVQETIERKHLNLGLKADFVEAWHRSPHKAQYFLYAKDEQNLNDALMMILGSETGREVTGKIKDTAVLVRTSVEGTILQGVKDGQ